jgi:hypothetical protein
MTCGSRSESGSGLSYYAGSVPGSGLKSIQIHNPVIRNRYDPDLFVGSRYGNSYKALNTEMDLNLNKKFDHYLIVRTIILKENYRYVLKVI